ncbi:hypothetical protein [Rahnella inusitata]|uniref:hypothetical protein n=1 Tax=Rahnella inusitata TaxID=58169 RepID=UPI001BC862C9|nr:hypothetical protein [Rahnella inusitata]QUT14099.1 hypothetical protein I2123_15515 [Rahnella inusitata]
MNNETKDSLLDGIRSCIMDLNISEGALRVVRFNLQTDDSFQDEYSITHLVIENIKTVRQMLNKLEQEYL